LFEILLINTNVMQPPVSPVGLDYVGTYLMENDEDVYLLDLALIRKDKRMPTLKDTIEKLQPDVIGLPVRNIDDCYCLSRDFMLPSIKEIVDYIRTLTNSPIVIGGVGFSVAPEEVMNFLDVDYGIVGDGEKPMLLLCKALRNEIDFSDVPGLIYRTSNVIARNEVTKQSHPINTRLLHDKTVRNDTKSDESDSYKKNKKLIKNPPDFDELIGCPYPLRYFIDNQNYFNQGGMVGIETKRGCAMKCIYCADPLSKGTKFRLRPVSVVIEEITNLVNNGLNVFHFCDSEFNLPLEHSLEICKEISKEELGQEIEWYAYVSPKPFDSDTAMTYKESGCKGLDFGVDSLNDEMLKNLGRDFDLENIIQAVEACEETGITCMLDLLIGGPGETKETITQTIERVKKLNPNRIGLSVGVRIYPGTKMEEMIQAMSDEEKKTCLFGEIEDNENLLRPIFYITEELGWDVHKFLADLIGDDERFFFTDPNKVDTNYNYNDNTVLIDAIKKGYKGAFWSILYRLRKNKTSL